MTDKTPDNVDDAIAAFAEAGQDEEMREMIAELIGFDEDDDNDQVGQVIAQIMDGKIKSEEDLEKLFSQFEEEKRKAQTVRKRRKIRNLIAML